MLDGKPVLTANHSFVPPNPVAGAGCVLLPSLSDFLSALEPQDRAALLALARRKPFKKGARIFEAGDPASMLYILESGRAKIYKTASSGKEIILWFCFPGETFGLAELSRGVERTISAQAVDDSNILCLQKVDFLRFITERPSAALCAIDILS
ncbi:MAG TPA: cyclic nucleotide-binding domain-containing protein, partial [Rhodospirillales bacterium]|nr:cyclic nucleotide-binding domain-containing protein [Rhodospirillales bacterium]